jgi:O-antigen ligase
MTAKLILFACLATFWWLIRRDMAWRQGLSSAIWIPTLWVGILASRPLSTWLGFGGVREDLESATAGSPIDMLGYLSLIVAAAVVLNRRRLNWSLTINRNWPVFLFYGYLLFSVLWANNPFVSSKRWFKEFGNILVGLVILTEANPEQALRAVFVRCGYVLIPLSLVFIRYFPEWGRRYNIHSGEQEAIGVTFQKNSLGVMVLVCSLVLLWDWFDLQRNRHQQGGKKRRLDSGVRLALLAIGGYLLHLCDSKTSIVCLMLSAGILTATRLPVLRKRLGVLTGLAVTGIAGFFILDQMFGIKEMVVQSLGRDMTFTGRTDVWQVLLKVGTDPLIGTGFCSFWDDPSFQSKLPYWVAFSAHNGYLEIYLAGGVLGLGLLAVMLVATGVRINKSLAWGGDFAVVRFAVFAVTLIANISESNFAVMTPLGFLFLLAAIGYARPERARHPVGESAARSRQAAPPFGVGADQPAILSQQA